MMTNISKLDEMYLNDPTFHAIVDMMSGVILKLELSPGEVRAAAMYAAYRAEIRRTTSVFLISGDDERNFQEYFHSVLKKSR